MTSKTKEVDLIDLDKLDKPAGRVKLKGVEHEVLAVDAPGYRVMRDIHAAHLKGEFPDIDKMYELAARAVPSLGTEDVENLKMEQVAAIIAIAGGRVDAVKQFAEQISKNANGAPGKSNGKRKV